jgi:hypothetical protein
LPLFTEVSKAKLVSKSPLTHEGMKLIDPKRPRKYEYALPPYQRKLHLRSRSKNLYLSNPPFGGCLSTRPRSTIQGKPTVKGGQRIAREQERRDLWGSEFIGGTVARTFINVTCVSFPSHMPPLP